MSELASQSEQKPLNNAVEIIELFGGIRPMASKINIAVTTIQGWKKRGVIPANRVDAVIEAAKSHNINIAQWVPQLAVSDVQGIPVAEKVNDNVQVQEMAEKQLPGSGDINVAPPMAKPVPRHDDTYERIKADQKRIEQEAAAKKAEPQKSTKAYAELVIEKKKVPKSVYVTLGLIVLATAATIGVMVPKKAGHKSESEQMMMAAVESQNAAVEEGDSWGAQLGNFAQEAGKTASQAADSVGGALVTAHDELTGPNGGVVGEQLVKAEKYAQQTIESSPVLSSLLDKYSQMRTSYSGEDYLEQSMSALNGMIMGDASQGQVSDESLMAQLDAARANNAYLSEAFSGVPRQDLKAAAMLLTMSQVRESLNRKDETFDKDLQTLRALVGDDDQELLTALDRLSSKAGKNGALTPTGLSKEFRGLAGDVLSASLNGEDLSLVERARDRMSDVFEVEKNGEILSGSKQQLILDETRKKVRGGDYDGAIAYIKEMMESKELEHLRPWMKSVYDALEAGKEILEKAQVKIENGDLSGAIDVLRRELDSKQLGVLDDWMGKASDVMSKVDIMDAPNKLDDAYRELDRAIGKVLQRRAAR